jgi:hypothetical protein
MILSDTGVGVDDPCEGIWDISRRVGQPGHQKTRFGGYGNRERVQYTAFVLRNRAFHCVFVYADRECCNVIVVGLFSLRIDVALLSRREQP